MSTKMARVDEIAVSLTRPRILIVDDDEDFLKGSREYFSGRGCEVDTARTPEEAKKILQEEGANNYQLIVTDYYFGGLSKITGDKFARENRHLLGKTKVVIISGAAGLTQDIRKKLKEAETLFLEKSPVLKTRLKEITEEETEKRASDIEKVVKAEVAPHIEKLTGRPVDVKVMTGPPRYVKHALTDLAVESMKQTLIKWLKSRGELDEPVLVYGKHVYSANDMIKQVEDETEVGLEHVRMLLGEFESTLEIDEDASQQYDDDEFAD
jgi:CheY-like chemotaxis protein